MQIQKNSSTHFKRYMVKELFRAVGFKENYINLSELEPQSVQGITIDESGKVKVTYRSIDYLIRLIMKERFNFIQKADVNLTKFLNYIKENKNVFNLESTYKSLISNIVFDMYKESLNRTHSFKELELANRIDDIESECNTQYLLERNKIILNTKHIPLSIEFKINIDMNEFINSVIWFTKLNKITENKLMVIQRNILYNSLEIEIVT